MIFLKSGSRTIEASDARTHSIGEPDSDFFTAKEVVATALGLVFLCRGHRPPEDDDSGRKIHNLNLINQRFESIQPDGLVEVKVTPGNRYRVAL